tara:strand:+ start:20 stop:964 length:945 start_codon:yes stop_codon:yes gene_type:complete
MAEATAGQISIGDESAGLDLLTSVPTEEEEKNSEGRTQTYSLLPQNEFSNITTTSPNISEVGVEVGNMLEAQNTVAPSPTIFTKYFDEAGNPTLRSRGDLKKTVYQIPQFKDPEDSYARILPIDPVNEIIDDLNNKYLFDPGDPTDPGFTTDDGQVGTGDKNFESFGEMAKSVAGSAATLFTTFSTPAIALDILGQVLGGGTSDDDGAPVEYPGQVAPGVYSRGAAGGGGSAGMSQADIDAAAAVQNNIAVLDAAAVQAANDPDAGVPSGPGDAAGATDGFDFSAPGAIDSFGFASGGTVKAKAKKVPSFMDSK